MGDMAQNSAEARAVTVRTPQKQRLCKREVSGIKHNLRNIVPIIEDG